MQDFNPLGTDLFEPNFEFGMMNENFKLTKQQTSAKIRLNFKLAEVILCIFIDMQRKLYLS